MREWITRICGLALMLLSFTVASQATAAEASRPDVRAVIDISGSMKKNDPNNLRRPALKLLVDLLPTGSKAGVWTFGAYVNMLVPHQAVDDAWREHARAQASKINSVALYTDIENALERASYDIDKPEPGFDRHIILLSDGMVDTSESRNSAIKRRENQASRDQILRKMLPKLKEAGYTIHTIALSDNADKDLLNTLAQRTGGLFAVAHNADDLMSLFMQALQRSVPVEEVPLQDNRFLIDDSINEFTALVFHKPDSQQTFLKDPNGRRYSEESRPGNVNWHSTRTYDLITAKEPASGEWQIETEVHPDNRVTVISDLKLNLADVPATLYRGYPVPLDAWFTEDGSLIKRDDFLSLLDVKATMTDENDQVLQQSAMTLEGQNPGHFTTRFDGPKQLGDQSIVVNVDGKTFQRSISRPVSVQDVVSAHLQLSAEGPEAKLILRAQHPKLDPANLQFQVQVGQDKGLTPEYRGDREWVLDLTEYDRRAPQAINVRVRGVLMDAPLDLTLPALTLPVYLRPGEEAQPPVPAEEEAPAFVPEPEVTALPEEPAVAEPVEESQPEAEAEAPKEESNLFGPIKDWDDPRLLWVYIAAGIVNILLLVVLFMLYRRFKKRRQQKAMEASPGYDEDEPLDLDDDDFDMDMELDLDDDKKT